MLLTRFAAALFLISVFSSPAQGEPLPTIALTFDHWRSTYDVAFPIMKEHGLVGTFYVDYRYVDANGGVTSEELREMQRAGWQIGAYTGFPMPALVLEDGERIADEALTNMWVALALKGFPTTSLAPASRAWAKRLSRISRSLFDNVRVIDMAGPQLSITDPHFIRGGATDSLSAGDTAETLQAAVQQMILKGGLHTIVVHQVGNDSNPISVSRAAFEALCVAIAAERAKGRLVAVTFDDAVRLWRAPKQ